MSQAIASKPLTYSIPEIRVLPLAALLGRIVLSLIFIASGAMKFMNWETTAGSMEAQGIPAANLLLPIAGAAEIIGGLALAGGFLTRWAALGLILFLIPTTYFFHDFWAVPAAEQQNQMQHFMKNLTIAGGLLMVLAFGAGPWSLDAWKAKKSSRMHTH